MITATGVLYLAYQCEHGIELHSDHGEALSAGPVHRFIAEHLQALKDGAVPASLAFNSAARKSTLVSTLGLVAIGNA